jgi:hypothetical protein
MDRAGRWRSRSVACDDGWATAKKISNGTSYRALKVGNVKKLEMRLALTNHVLIHADHHGSNAVLLTNWTEPT